LPLRALGQPRVAAASLALLVALFALRAATWPVGDPDVWWIAAAGRDLFHGLRPPTVNGWSFVDGARPWVMHEWAFGPLYARGLARWGPVFFVAAGMLFALAAVTSVVARTVGRARHLAGGASLAFLALAVGRECLFTPRPGYATLALPVLVGAVAFATSWRAFHPLAALALTLLWTNLHGSFPLGVALLAAGAVAADDRRRARALTAVACLGATFVNPYGARLHGLVDRYLRGGDPAADVIHASIAEFRPLWELREPFVNARVVVGLVAMAWLVARGLAYGDRARRVRACVVGALLALSVLHARHAVLCVVLGATLLVDELDAWLDRAALPDTSSVARGKILAASVGPGFALGALVLAWANARVASRADWISPGLGGREVVALARELPAGARVWAPFESTGLVVWVSGRRGARVLFDARNDCYSAAVITAGVMLEQGRGTARERCEVFRRYRVTHALAPAAHPVIVGLRACGWRESARRGAWVLLSE
jgi:hypothetical protein